MPRAAYDLSQGNVGSAAMNAIPALPAHVAVFKKAQALLNKAPVVGAAAVPAGIAGVGGALSQVAAKQLRDNKLHRQQMQSMSEDPLGGALS